MKAGRMADAEWQRCAQVLSELTDGAGGAHGVAHLVLVETQRARESEAALLALVREEVSAYGSDEHLRSCSLGACSLSNEPLPCDCWLGRARQVLEGAGVAP